MVRHNHQYGGTKMSIRQNKGAENESWVPTTDDNTISLMSLQNLCTLKVVSSSSLCSMVLVGMLKPDSDIRKRSQIYQEDGTRFPPIKRANRQRFTNQGKLEPYVCLKISLVVGHDEENRTLLWHQSPHEIKTKKTTRLAEIRKEVASQRAAALGMLCGENASDIIPDILSECIMTHDNFTKISKIISSNNASYVAASKDETQVIDPETKRVVTWINDNANTNNFNVHIALMDYIEGFTTVNAFFISNPHQDTQFDISCKALAVILILLLKGRIMSWDFHSENLLTNGIFVKGTDFGRIYTLGITNDDPIKKDRHQIKNFAFSEIFKLDQSIISDAKISLKNFFNVKNIAADPSSKNLDRFSDDFKRLLVDFPDHAYEFSTWSHEDKRKNVYEAIMMLAFIDGVTNACLYKVKGIQCSTVLKCAFGIGKPFDTFENFLNYFRMDYNIFLDTRDPWPDVIDKVNRALDRICQLLEPQLVPCIHPRRQTQASFYLAADSDDEGSDAPKPEPQLEPDNEPEELYTIDTKRPRDILVEEGGSNRRRRSRNSNKKRKYKSRKIRSRRKRK